MIFSSKDNKHSFWTIQIEKSFIFLQNTQNLKERILLDRFFAANKLFRFEILHIYKK